MKLPIGFDHDSSIRVIRPYKTLFDIFMPILTAFNNALGAGKTRPARPLTHFAHTAQPAEEAEKLPAGRPSAPDHIIVTNQ